MPYSKKNFRYFLKKPLSFFAFFLLFSGIKEKSGHTSAEYHYSFEPFFDQGKISHIKANLYINHHYQTNYLYSTNNAGYFPETIKNIKVLTPSVTLSQVYPNQYMLQSLHGYKGQVVQLSYDIIVPQKLNNPRVSGISQEAIYLTAHEALLCPAFYYIVTEPIKAYITWRGLPEGWSTAGNNGIGEAQYFEGDSSNFQQSYFIAGKWEFQPLIVKENTIMVAYQPRMNSLKEKILYKVQQIVEATNTFFSKQDRFPFYLFSFITNEDTLQYGGRAYYNGSFIILPKFLDYAEVDHLIAHEYFHQWNPSAFYKGRENNNTTRWFTEGITDYYANLLCLRQGMIKAEEWIKCINDAIKNYYYSDWLYFNNEQLKALFATGEYYSFPYEKGMVLGLYINQKIKEYKEGFSLDDFFKDLLHYTHYSKKKLGFKSIMYVLSTYLPNEILEEIRLMIKGGKPISLNAFTLGEGANAIKKEVRRNLTTGIDLENSLKQGRITAVTPFSAAAQAGLKAGQKILAGSVNKTLEGLTLTVEIEENNLRKTIIVPLVKIIHFPLYQIKNRSALQQEWSRKK